MHTKALEPSSDNVCDVLLDGKSIYDVCCEADDVEGWAMIYDHEYIDGALHIIGGEAKKVFGKVKIVMSEPSNATRL